MQDTSVEPITPEDAGGPDAYDWIAHVVRPFLTILFAIAFLYKDIYMGQVDGYLAGATFAMLIWWFGERSVLQGIESIKGFMTTMQVNQTAGVTQAVKDVVAATAVATPDSVPPIISPDGTPIVQPATSPTPTPTAPEVTNETVRSDPGTSIPVSMSGPKPQADLSPYCDPDLPPELQAVVDNWINRQITDPFVVPAIPEPQAPPDGFMSLRDKRMAQESAAELAIAAKVAQVWDKQRDTNGLIMSYPCGSKARGSIANCYTEAQQRWEHYAVQLCEWVYP